MNPAVIAAIILISVLILIRAGAPKIISLAVEPPVEDFERFGPDGRKEKAPLLVSLRGLGAPFAASLKATVKISGGLPVFRRIAEAFLDLEIGLEADPGSLPPGWDVMLARSATDPDAKPRGHIRVLPAGGNRVTEWLIQVRGPEALSMIRMRLVMTAQAARRWNFPLRTPSHSVSLPFFAGPQPGGWCVGIDLGASASCVAASDRPGVIHIEQNSRTGQDLITPSMVVIDPARLPSPPAGEVLTELPPEALLCGADAWLNFGKPGLYSFQSFKKFMGYSDRIPIEHQGRTIASLDPVNLSAGLIHSLLSDFTPWMRQQTGREFLPQRCVVAVPNVFSTPQIRALWQVVRGMGFMEVRCISEAEAVFYYYLSSRQDIPKKMRVLIVDMGASTVNATSLASEQLSNGTYRIDILSRLGYTLGGDSIDYFLCREIAEAMDADKAANFAEIHPFKPHQPPRGDAEQRALMVKWKLFAEKIKINLIELSNGRRSVPVTALEVMEVMNDSFRDELGNDSLGRNPGTRMKALFEERNPELMHALTSSRLMRERIFRPVDRIVRESIELSGGEAPDVVVCSGRSTEFPGVKRTIEDALAKFPGRCVVERLPHDRLKSAVARGCCWYGINRRGLRIAGRRSSVSVGYAQKPGLNDEFPVFVPVVTAGELLRPSGGDGPACTVSPAKMVAEPRNFSWDNGWLRVYQMMGIPGDEDGLRVSREAMHRYKPVMDFMVTAPVHRTAACIDEEDNISFSVDFGNGHEETRSTSTHNQPVNYNISDYHDEDYYWFIGI